MRVLFHFDATDALLERLEPIWAGLDVRCCPEQDEESLARQLPETDVLWHVLRPITARDMDMAPRLRLIQKLGSGVNTIDRDHARSRGIAVANMVGANAPAVAEAALGLMLAVLRRTVLLDHRTRAGRGWPIDPMLANSVGEINGRTVGLIGYGAIARMLERPLAAMGATVLHHARSGRDEPGWVPLDSLLASSDIVSLHVPLTSETQGLIDAAAFAAMRPGAILINTARGGLIDEPALVDSLRSGRLRGAGLDTFGQEPLGSDNPLADLDSVVLSPHVAWLTTETVVRCVQIAAENTRRVAAGELPDGLVP